MTTPGMEHLLGLPMSRNAGMATEEHAAQILGLLCETASGQFPDERGMLVNYRQIPDVVWEKLPGQFGFALTEGAMERMKEAASFDAKNRSRRFEGDSARRQAEASEEIRRAAERWVAPPYERLEELRVQGSGLNRFPPRREDLLELASEFGGVLKFP